MDCTHKEAALAVEAALPEQIAFLVEALEQYAMIASPMGEIARTTLALYKLPTREQRRAMSIRSTEIMKARIKPA